MATHVCPWWNGYLLASPLRKAFQNPKVILGGYLKPGMAVLDLGCGMGFFSLPAAVLVGESGRVYAVDLQAKMLDSLKRRAEKIGLSGRIEARQCSERSLAINDIHGMIDFALAFAMIHEVPDPKRFLEEVKHAVISGGKLLMAEPRGHVSRDDFDRTVSAAQKQGFDVVEYPEVRGSFVVLMQKK